MRKAAFWALFCAGALFIWEAPIFADISIGVVGGDVNFAIGSSNLAGGAGINLMSDYESAEGTALLNITGATNSDDAWKVRVRATFASWPENMALFVRRTGDGDGSGAISGGTAYVPVEASDADFFSGSGSIMNIPVQYKTSGMSLAVPPGAYSATIVYTVVES